jgi:hypothetical protein
MRHKRRKKFLEADLMLKAIQTTFANDITHQQAKGDYFSSADFDSGELIQIYRNNYTLSLTDALKSSYSCVLRLVGEDFFKLLAKNYISEYPLNTACLQNYGDSFKQFLSNFEACKSYPYLVDIAEFERYYEQCYHSKNAQFIMCSIYPIIDIWQLSEDSEDLDFTYQGQCVSIVKKNLKVVVSKISQSNFSALGGENGEII